MIELQHCQKRSAARIALVLGVTLYLATGVLLLALYASIRALLLHNFPALGVSMMSFLLFWLGGTLPVAVLSCCFGLFFAAMYNRSARWWGGLRFDLGRVGEEQAVDTARQDLHEAGEAAPALPKHAVLLSPRHTMRLSKPKRTNHAESTNNQEE